VTGPRTAYGMVAAAVTVVLLGLCLLGWGLTALTGLPRRLELPPAARIGGLLAFSTGLGLFVWIIRHRRVRDILYSTFVTFRQAVRGSGVPPETRPEPLVVSGPQRHVRHPMYSAVVLLTLGWWLALDYTFLLVTTALLLAWFRLVVIPFEERELRARFGAEYAEYADRTPRLIPSLRRLTGSRREGAAP